MVDAFRAERLMYLRIEKVDYKVFFFLFRVLDEIEYLECSISGFNLI